jgi:hypothetical protein
VRAFKFPEYPVADSSREQNENVDHPTKESILGGYFGQLSKIIESEDDPKHAAVWFFQQLGGTYFIAVLRVISEMEHLCRETKSVLNEFIGRDLVLVRVLTVEHLAVSMKLYVISWSTLLDLLACLINVVFNLGIADRDVKMQLVLNNRHVQSSRIPQIIREYEKVSVIKDLKKKRNDLVHRGKIPDTDIEQILGERNRIDSRRYSILQMNQISEEEYKKQSSILQEKLSVLAKGKQELWREHHQQTITMLSEIGGELALKTIESYKQRST